MWKLRIQPNYLKPDFFTGDTQDWQTNPDFIKDLNVYNWPPERTDSNTETYNPGDKTYAWVNRIHSGRGLDSDQYTGAWIKGWTTPSYLVGYSPVWVAGGINNDTDWWDACGNWNYTSNANYPDSSSGLPIWEALNPYFTSKAGMYTATDADMNSYMAYKLADLKWGSNQPDLSSIDESQGYNCDVADWDGVKQAFGDSDISGSTTFYDISGDFYPNQQTLYTKEVTTYITTKIGYGVDISGTPTSLTSVGVEDFKIPKDSLGNNMTTWNYMHKSISRCLISTVGLTGDDNYGNFTNFLNSFNKRIVTLGRDTNESSIKSDYIDLSVYQNAKEDGPDYSS